jgi:dimethylglycine dehydrogenase
MNAMRMEKGFKGAGELTNEVTLPEADVMRFVRMDKAFRGKAATKAVLAEPLRWICAYLEIDGDGISDGNGGEAILSGGKQVGTVSSIAFGHGIGKLLAFAYMKAEHAKPETQLEVVIMGDARQARILSDPAYDPDSTRPRSDFNAGKQL